MKQRNPIAVFFLTIFTFGIYGIVWDVKTKNEMNQRGAAIPTAWLIIIPLVNLWWQWKYSEGVELVTNKEMSTVIAFILIILLGPIGAAIVQNEFNKVGAPAAEGAGPAPGSLVGSTPEQASEPAAATTTPESPAPTSEAPAPEAPATPATDAPSETPTETSSNDTPPAAGPSGNIVSG